MDKHKILGVTLALMTGTFWGFTAPMGKMLVHYGTNMVTVIFLRTIIVCLVTAPWILLADGPKGLRASRSEIPFYMLLGVMNTPFTALGFFSSLQYLSIPVALLVHYLFPMATLVGEFFIFREAPTARKIIAGLLVLAGLWVGMTQTEPGAVMEVSFLGLIWGLLAVVGLAGQSLMGKIAARRRYNFRKVLLYSHIFGAVYIGLIKIFTSGMGDVPLLSSPEWLLITLTALSAGVLAYAAYYIALRYISSSLGSLLCTSEIVVGMAASALVLMAPPTLFEVAGGGIIIFAIGLSVF